MRVDGSTPYAAKPTRLFSRSRSVLSRWALDAKWAVLRRLFRHDIAAVDAILRTTRFAEILRQHPDIPLKPVRDYLTVHLRRRHRALAVITHYTAAARLLSDDALIRTHTTGLRLFQLATDAGQVTVELTGQAGLYREGECRLVLLLDTRPIAEMGLALVSTSLLRLSGHGTVLWIGALKSASVGTAGSQDARILTEALEGMHPITVLLRVAQSLVRSLRLCGLIGASNAGHVFARAHSLRRRLSTDYDRFWTESGGRRAGPHLFVLPRTKAQHDLVSPNQRLRRRHQFETEVSRQSDEAVRGMLRS